MMDADNDGWWMGVGQATKGGAVWYRQSFDEGSLPHCLLAASLFFDSPSLSLTLSRPATVRRILFLVSRHVNSTLDSKHGCKGGVHNAKSRSWGIDIDKHH